VLGVRVPMQWQFGQVDAVDGRPSAMRRALALEIQRHLFDAAAQPTADRAPLDAKQPEKRLVFPFSLALGRFAHNWSADRPNRPELQQLLQALASRRAGESEEGVGAAERHAEAEAAFCLTLYELCRCLADGQLPRSPLIQEIEGRDDDAEGDDSDPKEDGAADEEDDPDVTDGEISGSVRPAVDAALVRSELAALLMRTLPMREPGSESVKPSAAGKRGRVCGREGPTRDDARLLARWMIERLVDCMPDHFAREKPADKPKAREQIVVRSPDLPGRMERLLRTLPFSFTAQPLKQPVRHGGMAADDESSMRIPLLGYRRTNAFLEVFLRKALSDAPGRSFDYTRYVDAINLQQTVPWRINAALLFHARCLAALGREDKESSRQAKPWIKDARPAIAAARLDDDTMQEIRQWVAEKFCRPPNERRDSHDPGPGEFLDHPLADKALGDLARPGVDGALPSFFLPWKADYRGRIFAETPWLTPQGGDLQRALFELARGRPLDEEGIKALRRHGANLVKRQQILVDLEIEGRKVLTLEERERWIVEHEDEIMASAASPLAHGFWRKLATKPMQFLAFCLAYRQWRLDPRAAVHLPIQIDGTCNGLQHIAALTGNIELAKAVNVMRREGRLPADIYSELAAAAQETVGAVRPLLGRVRDPLRSVLIEADEMLARQPDWREWLDRSAAKAVVMTIPYGASQNSQARKVLESIESNLLNDEGRLRLERDGEVWRLAQGWSQTIGAHSEFDRMIRKCARRRFKALRQSHDPGAREELRLAIVLGSLLARVFVAHVRDALTRRFPVVDDFRSWLRKVAASCEGLPLTWLTPLGLPVCQDRFVVSDSTLNARAAGQKISIGTKRLEEIVSPRGQEDALLPNLIHSLDATHLGMTINSAHKNGIEEIGTIHDCLLCHPNDAARLASVVQGTFARLYRAKPGAAAPEVLEDWTAWMDFVARLAAVRDPQLLRGILDRPEGFGEVQLRKQAAEREDARQALAVLAEIRAFDPARQALARLLLDYGCTVPIAPERERPRTRGPKPTRKRHPLDAAAPKLARGVLPLVDGKEISEYFFS
jgi:hypothetical protein